MKVLVLGASGMLGNAIFRMLATGPDLDVRATVRGMQPPAVFDADLQEMVVTGIDVMNSDDLIALFARECPDVVINCIGLVKQLTEANDPLKALPINALLPHRLAQLCAMQQARLVHISTDCVFSGSCGPYRETDVPDADDLYGRSKLLGEVAYTHSITLRTSIIGHEIGSANGLVGWFLSQTGRIKGYTKAIFSGLPTVELSEIVRDIVLPRPELNGLYHVASAPISKHDLLQIINREYSRSLDIEASEQVVIDRSLDGSRFSHDTGYIAPDWDELVAKMHAFN